jgi:hypothetical protein
MEALLCAMAYIPRNGFAVQRQLLQTDFQEIAMIRKVILAAMLAASFGSIATPATAAIIVQIAPPSPRAEVVPQPRRGYVWVGGYWDWRGNKHHWVKGTWVKERRGYQYNQPAWAERDGRWQLDRGNWRRGDRDGDGVPNRQDRAPDNPNRR